MHVLISDAGLAPGFSLPPLPQLSRLLQEWALQTELGGDPTDPHPPAERWLGQQRGHAPQEALPTASWALQAAGIDPGALPWALLTPLHVQLDAKQALVLRPAQLRLNEVGSRSLWQAIAPLFPSSEGWQTHWLGPTQWLIGHPELAHWQAASLERVELRTLDAWLPASRPLRRLQNEIQMTFHAHPLNAERETTGALPVNSVWISGCGVVRGTAPTVTHRPELREPQLQANTEAWAQAWAALDADCIGPLLASGGSLTLAGETWARTWAPQRRSWWQTLLRRPDRTLLQRTLEAL
jgi:hypothetical protein